MTWLVIDPDGTLHEREDPVTLQALQGAVGGYIEWVGKPQPRVAAFGDEEGALKLKAPNLAASRLLGHLVVGPIVLVGVAGEREVPLRPEDLDFLKSTLRLLTSK